MTVQNKKTMHSISSVSLEKNAKNLEFDKDRYRVFIEDIADGFYETDLKGNFTFFNDAMCRIFGYSRQEMENRNYRDFMDERNASIAYDSFNRIYRDGKQLTDILWKIKGKDGHTRILEITAGLLVDDVGNKIGFRGTCRDITEKHLARESLKKSEQCALELYENSRLAERRYRALLDFLPDPVFVFNLDGTVSYLNPAFESVFGWKREEMKGKRIPFVPENFKAETRRGMERLFREGMISGYETRRLTKDGRILDIVLDAAIFYDDDQQPAGQISIFRNVTEEKLAKRTSRALSGIATALPNYRILDDLLEFIINEVKNLVSANGASVIILDEEANEFFFRTARYDDTQTGKNLKEIRFPSHKGVAGHVYKTGEPIIIHDTSTCPFFFQNVDEQSGYRTHNMIDVPIKTPERTIGVLCAVNKKEGRFDQADMDLLSAVASSVAMPIENARIHEELHRSYEEVRTLNRAKERVIHHLSHELKTPISVLSASIALLRKKLLAKTDESIQRIIHRAERNLNRILEMQYQIEDILREKDFKTYRMLTGMLDACVDEMEVMAETGFWNKYGQMQNGDAIVSGVLKYIRKCTEGKFGNGDDQESKTIRLTDFVSDTIEDLKPRFSHRTLDVHLSFPDVEKGDTVFLPPQILRKVVEGLLRNAVENTPDHGRIEVGVRSGVRGPELAVKDYGVGITPQNQPMLFESYLTTSETFQYASKNPYDFNAGGKGFDLLRMKIFSERYHFKISMRTIRCVHIPKDEDLCPGDIKNCHHCQSVQHCLESGGTEMIIQFISDGIESLSLDKG